MVGMLTTIGTDRKPVVLWTPWGAIPKAPLLGRQARPRARMHNTVEPARRAADRDGGRKPS